MKTALPIAPYYQPEAFRKIVAELREIHARELRDSPRWKRWWLMLRIQIEAGRIYRNRV